MEVRSEPGIMSNRDSFTISVQKSPTSSPTPAAQNMRMPYAGDGTSVFRPVSGGLGTASYHVGSGEFSSGQGLGVNSGETVKRKRGRPRKYAPGGKIPIGLSSPPASSPAPTGFSLSYSSAATPRQLESSSAVEEMKKVRGRPAGSSKKHNFAGLGLGGIGFTAHVITVKAGEDVSSKIMSFSHHGPRAVCILSANGAISNVTLRQAATSGGTVTYEGRFEILSLSGSFLQSEGSSGHRSRTGGLSVSLAGPDGRVMGGGVAGLLTAASPIQVVVGSFIPDSARKDAQQMHPSDAASGPGNLATGGMQVPSSPTSRGTLSESSGGGPGSPLNQSANGNNNQQSLASMPWK